MPEWLPEILDVDPWKAETYEYLYSIFCANIRDYNLLYYGNSVWTFNELEDGKETIFWHLTTRKEKAKPIPRHKRRFYPADQTHDPTGERLPDHRRCERLNWVRPLIENADDQEVLTWDYEEGDGKIKTYVWLKDYDFVVIMKKYSNNTRRIITSFYIDKPWLRKDLEKRYDKREA